jgi:hypothetical protein
MGVIEVCTCIAIQIVETKHVQRLYINRQDIFDSNENRYISSDSSFNQEFSLDVPYPRKKRRPLELVAEGARYLGAKVFSVGIFATLLAAGVSSGLGSALGALPFSEALTDLVSALDEALFAPLDDFAPFDGTVSTSFLESDTTVCAAFLVSVVTVSTAFLASVLQSLTA